MLLPRNCASSSDFGRVHKTWQQLNCPDRFWGPGESTNNLRASERSHAVQTGFDIRQHGKRSEKFPHHAVPTKPHWPSEDETLCNALSKKEPHTLQAWSSLWHISQTGGKHGQAPGCKWHHAAVAAGAGTARFQILGWIYNGGVSEQAGRHSELARPLSLPRRICVWWLANWRHSKPCVCVYAGARTGGFKIILICWLCFLTSPCP